MLPPLPRRSVWAYCFAQSPSRISLPRKGCRVGLRIVLFEACLAFTLVAACTLALSPIRDTHSEGFSQFVTSLAAPVASGWSGRRGGLAPTGKRRLVTAHTRRRHWARSESLKIGRSFCLDACFLNDLCPSHAVGAELSSTLFRRASDWLEAKRRHSLPDIRQRQNLDDLSIEQRDDVFGRSGRHDDGEPCVGLHARISGFRHVRHVRQHLRSLIAGYRQRAKLAVFDLRH